MKETLAIQRQIYGENNPSVMGTLLSLGDVLGQEGKLADAQVDVSAAIAIQRKRPEEERTNPNLSFWIGAVFQKLGKLPEAEEWYRRCSTI